MMRADIYNEDCITGMAEHLDPGSVHLTITSIPFEELFSYSSKLECLSNNGSTIDIREGRFAHNMRFVIEQLFRAHAPGTNCCIHIQQLLAYQNQHGFIGRRDFRGAMIEVFSAGGFQFKAEEVHPAAADDITPDELTALMEACGDDYRTLTQALRVRLRLGSPLPTEFVIPKDPQAMAQRLNLLSLQFKTGHTSTSTQWGMAPNDYLLVFQKPGAVEHPVRPLVYKPGEKPQRREDFYQQLGRKDAMAYAAYVQEWGREVGAKNLTGWLSADDWIKWASGVWDDIDEFDILDGARGVRESDQEKHVCPLQLGVIERAILLYSNPATIQPGVLVLDPFMGIGSSAHVAVTLGRNVVGFELKESYHKAAVENVHKALGAAERAAAQTNLFAGEVAA
jgi:DNA modification methylase